MDLEDFEVLVVLDSWGTLWILPNHWIQKSPQCFIYRLTKGGNRLPL